MTKHEKVLLRDRKMRTVRHTDTQTENITSRRYVRGR